MYSLILAVIKSVSFIKYEYCLYHHHSLTTPADDVCCCLCCCCKFIYRIKRIKTLYETNIHSEIIIFNSLGGKARSIIPFKFFLNVFYCILMVLDEFSLLVLRLFLPTHCGLILKFSFTHFSSCNVDEMEIFNLENSLMSQTVNLVSRKWNRMSEKCTFI